MNSLPARMAHVYQVMRRAHALHVAPLAVLFVWLLLRSGVGAAMALDRLASPRLRRIRADRPIVIVGHPRSGTTFLHRFLAQQGVGTGTPLASLLYPALCLQPLLRPLLPWLEKISPARYHSKDVHETSLRAIETDDAALLFRHLDGLFLYGFFSSFDSEDRLQQTFARVQASTQRDCDWLQAVWRRHLVVQGGERNLAKLFSLSLRLPAFQARFPGAQVLYLARDPRAVIPSAMSLVVGVLDGAVGFWCKPEDVRRRWLDRMYRAWVLLFQRFHSDWESGAIDRSRVLVVRYDRMMDELEAVAGEICAFVGHAPTPAFTAEVRRQAEAQRAYRSRHAYDLERFGLSEQQVLQDCAAYMATFLPPRQKESPMS